jgi:hypothetical protein
MSLAGASARRTGAFWVPAAAAAAGVSIIALAVVLYERGDGVSAESYARGLVVLGIGMAVVLAVYFLVGWLAGKRWWLVVLLYAASLVPLLYATFILTFFVADLATCAPDAYECPI